MIDKSIFQSFDECVARCVHISPQEENCTSSSWGDRKIYTSGSRVNLQKETTEIDKTGDIAKVKMLEQI